jgi:hypothetical protein
MIKTKESARCALGALTVEMTKSPIAASAQEAMHPADGRQRRLMLIHEEPFHGYACSWCGCRFPKTKTDVPNPVSLFETLRLAREQRRKQFSDHVCSERPYTVR